LYTYHMPYITRTAEKTLAQMLKTSKVSIILGARQVGKTTLVEHVLGQQKTTFLNLDLEIDKQRLLAASTLVPNDALRALGQPDILVIDEAQVLPETSKIVKGWYDARLPLKVFLLGSSSLDLADQSVESLAGRNEKLFLPPLLFQEVVSHQSWYSDVFTHDHLTSHFSNQIQTCLMSGLSLGQYPEAVTTSNPSDYLRNLASDYLWKDTLQLGNVRNPDLIRRLLMLLAYQIGSEVSVNELANNLSMSRDTVNRYIDLLEQTFIIFRLPAFSTNPRKEINKNHKIYFWDVGIRNALLNNLETHALRPDIGDLWENWIIAEFAKQNLLTGQQHTLHFWRSRSHSEVDLVIKSGTQLRAYEIKWNKKKASNRAFTSHYGVDVEVINNKNPFVTL
jgi:uncharacterized protein